jgi:UDP-N-acetylmuramoyl-tripeptide--D-alanyl-D-alanine ligase
MKKFLISELAQIIRAAPPTGDNVITGISTDSRTTKAGDCFFAIPGEKFDGHDYVADAFAKGAACAVIRAEEAEKTGGGCLLKVDDTVKALGNLARHYRQQTDYKVVAITGSVGKTTTRHITYHVLSQHFRCHQSPKSFNNNIGVPLTLLGADPEDQIVVAELGTNHPGEIAYLTRIAQPDIAVVTNVQPAHLEGLGDLKAIAEEKLSISEVLRTGGVLIINGDIDLLVETCRAKGMKFTTFGKSKNCDIPFGNVTTDGLSSRFIVEGAEIFLPLAGFGNVENAVAAWAICRQVGLTIDDFAKAVRTLPPVPMRAELLQIGTLTVLNDCYNANPASMKNALDILTNLDLAKKQRLVFICGDMAELGRQAEALHADLGSAIAQTNIQLLLTVGKLAEITARTASKNAKDNLQTKSFDDTLSACNNLKKFIKDYDIILVKGSRVAGLEMVVEKLREIFNR